MANTIVSASIQLRRDTHQNWTGSSIQLKAGEVAIATNTDPLEFRIGNGSSTWAQLTPQYINGVNKVVYEGVECDNNSGTVTISGITASQAVTASYAHIAHIAETGGTVVEYVKSSSRLVDDTSAHNVMSSGSLTQPVYFDKGIPKACTSYANAYVYSASKAKNAETASRLSNTTAIGDINTPVYIDSTGLPKTCSSIGGLDGKLNTSSFNNWTGSTNSTFKGTAATASFVTASNVKGTVVSASYALSSSYALVAESVKSGGGLTVTHAEHASYLADAAGTRTAVGANNNPVYFNDGLPVAITGNSGSATRPIYILGGKYAICNEMPDASALYQYTASNDSWKTSSTASFAGTAAKADVATGLGNSSNTSASVAAAIAAKWTYNADTIKGVKVTSASRADSAKNADTASYLENNDGYLNLGKGEFLYDGTMCLTASSDIEIKAGDTIYMYGHVLPGNSNSYNLGGAGDCWNKAYITSITGSLFGTASQAVSASRADSAASAYSATIAQGVNNDGTYISCDDDTMVLSTAGGTLTLTTDDNDIYIQPGGAGETYINSNVIPNDDNSYSLGSSDYVWKSANITSITGSLFGTASWANNVLASGVSGTVTSASKAVGVSNAAGDIYSAGSGNTLEMYANNNLYLESDNGKITIDADTDIVLSGLVVFDSTYGKVSSSIIPSASRTFDLGSVTNRWNRGYFSNIETEYAISSSYLISNYITTQTLKATTITGSNVYASGDVVAGYTSDRRLKEDIKPIESTEADEVLQALKPVSFKWNKLEEELTDGHRKGIARSFIADEFLQVLPNAGQKIYDDQYDAIYIEQVIPYLVAGYQKQQQEIDDLRKEIAELKAKLA